MAMHRENFEMNPESDLLAFESGITDNVFSHLWLTTFFYLVLLPLFLRKVGLLSSYSDYLNRTVSLGKNIAWLAFHSVRITFNVVNRIRHLFAANGRPRRNPQGIWTHNTRNNPTVPHASPSRNRGRPGNRQPRHADRYELEAFGARNNVVPRQRNRFRNNPTRNNNRDQNAALFCILLIIFFSANSNKKDVNDFQGVDKEGVNWNYGIMDQYPQGVHSYNDTCPRETLYRHGPSVFMGPNNVYRGLDQCPIKEP